jgi:hypothetical protein
MCRLQGPIHKGNGYCEGGIYKIFEKIAVSFQRKNKLAARKGCWHNKMASETKKHLVKRWEVSIMELQNTFGRKFKVTKRLPEMSVAETKIFRSKEEAKRQFEEWLE